MRLNFAILAFGLILTASDLGAVEPPTFESMPTLTASALAPPNLIKGADYSVSASVPVVGYMGQFTLETAYGKIKADGTEMLAIRIAELPAIAALKKMSSSQVFSDALAASAEKTGKAIGRAVTNPVDTVAAVPAGVGRFFQSTAKSISRAADSAVGGDSEESASTTDTAEDLLGVNEAKRKIAKQVGADPYTTNPVLAKELNDLSRAAFLGGVSLDVALSVSTAGVGTAISATASVSDLAWDKSPADIRTINEDKLTKMGVGADTIRIFVTNKWFMPTLAVPFVDNLAEISKAKGCAAIVTLAGGVKSEIEARYLLNAVSMARELNSTSNPVTDIDVVGRIIVVHQKSGKLVVPAPVDYIVWTEPVSKFAEKTQPSAKEREILVTGSASERTNKELAKAGWVLKDHVAVKH